MRARKIHFQCARKSKNKELEQRILISKNASMYYRTYTQLCRILLIKTKNLLTLEHRALFLISSRKILVIEKRIKFLTNCANYGKREGKSAVVRFPKHWSYLPICRTLPTDSRQPIATDGRQVRESSSRVGKTLSVASKYSSMIGLWINIAGQLKQDYPIRWLDRERGTQQSY